VELRFGQHILTVLLCNFAFDAVFFTSFLSRDVAQHRTAHTLDRNLAVSGLILSGSVCNLPNESSNADCSVRTFGSEDFGCDSIVEPNPNASVMICLTEPRDV
jgi:hypothetical protein